MGEALHHTYKTCHYLMRDTHVHTEHDQRKETMPINS
jgi:hypothetical protein